MADQLFDGVIEKGRGVSLRPNDAPRTFEMPPELAEALVTLLRNRKKPA